LALQKSRATTARPVGICTTCSTPATDFASAASNDLTLPPNTGERATSAVRKPGKRTSMPNCAFPVTFSGESSRRVGLPSSFQRLRSLSVTFFGGCCACAARASCP